MSVAFDGNYIRKIRLKYQMYFSFNNLLGDYLVLMHGIKKLKIYKL